MTVVSATYANAGELAIVIDDLGHNLARAQRVIDLPGRFTLGLLPFAPASVSIAHAAHAAGHEVILHQPMEPERLREAREEIGTLKRAMLDSEFEALLAASVKAIPRIRGVSNHTGSLLTADEASMRRLMSSLTETGLYFLDSRTSSHTVAHRVARTLDVPTIARDVFLDHKPTIEHVHQQFARALRIMHLRGHVVVVGHPHVVTLRFLESRLSNLPSGTRLRLVSELIDHSTMTVAVNAAME
ncbi:MAG: divergent polysaccharide deacetylase family protein [Pseudomonadales bacterium]|nr:divergent polysaccharide deacetylase family protein [Pseudomonadales bacterium]MDP6472582.1 divergent polysaccharide deacetylase family protein [Pseudomonadales bacterium]MDP6829296.1 divergent polysaccharide deacetylase family protein [Pseudomonadales bacterium]MDP6971836.1 divergent polysaccharide deacetylase family protein [Pseudomonadales bacterium]